MKGRDHQSDPVVVGGIRASISVVRLLLKISCNISNLGRPNGALYCLGRHLLKRS